jgi:nucleotide-binding universal stress UspA family protein
VARKILTKEKISHQILQRSDETKADLIVLGAHSISAIKRLTFGSTTHELITKTNTPLFLNP